MSVGKLRYGEENNIPLDKPVWGIIIRTDKGKTEEEVIHFSEKGNRFIIEDLESMKKSDLLYIVWHGSWNTDVFRCDPKKILERLKKQEEKS